MTPSTKTAIHSVSIAMRSQQGCHPARELTEVIFMRRAVMTATSRTGMGLASARMLAGKCSDECEGPVEVVRLEIECT